MTLDSKDYHLYLRAGFGPRWEDICSPDSERLSVEQLFKTSKDFIPIEGDDLPERVGRKFRQMDKAAQMKALKNNRQAIGKVNLQWFATMCASQGQLREKMAFFWHDHFACKTRIAQTALLQVNTLRKHAIGNFGELLHAIAKDPGMLLFLNNQQNKKSHPNENFARELLELFTLGRGNYTEKDVKEAARAFTGWGSLPNGSFFFRRRQHDYGRKSFLGRKGNFTGEDIIDILLEEKATAYQVTRKLYRYLVNPKEDPEQIEQWAQVFYESHYDLKTLLTAIFQSETFKAPQNRGVRIKSPIEYLVGIFRLLECRDYDSKGILVMQKALGQTLFFPPNVAGWPENTAWIDGSTLLTRMQFPYLLKGPGELMMEPKSAFAGNEEFLPNFKRERVIDLQVDWVNLLQSWKEVSRTSKHSDLRQAVLPYSKKSPKNESGSLVAGDFPEALVELIATPEFQLC